MNATTIDPFVAVLPDRHLGGFDKLPADEQSWRARIYWITYLWSGSAPFSWAVAMNRDPAEVEVMRTFVTSSDDAWILAGLREIDDERDPGLRRALAGVGA